MYIFAQKTFDFPGWHQAIARHWPPYLAGSISRREATARIVREIAAGPAAAGIRGSLFCFRFVNLDSWRLTQGEAGF